jgi:putative toxin-antitoxin system antitoxin component (TIGR02293 family)
MHLRVAATKDATRLRSLLKHASTKEKIVAIRAGIPARVVDDVARRVGVPKNVIFGVLHTPESTAHKLIRDDRTLDAAASERIMRVVEIVREAEEVFGGRDPAAQWLTRANAALGGAMPLSMLDTEPGAAEVRRVLSSISYGGPF